MSAAKSSVLKEKDAQLRYKAEKTLEELFSSLKISDNAENGKVVAKDNPLWQYVERLETCLKEFEGALSADAGSCGTMSFSGFDTKVDLGCHDTVPHGCDHKLSEVIVHRGYRIKVVVNFGLEQEKCITFSSGKHKISEEVCMRVGSYEGERDALESYDILQEVIRARINLMQVTHTVKCLEVDDVETLDAELNKQKIFKIAVKETLELQLKADTTCDQVMLEALELVHASTRQWINKAVLQKIAQSTIVTREAREIINQTKENELRMKCAVFMHLLHITGKGTVFHMAMELYFLQRRIAQTDCGSRSEAKKVKHSHDPLIMMELYSSCLISKVCKFIDENETIQRSSFSNCKPECPLKTTDCGDARPPKRADLLIEEETLVTIYDWKFPEAPWGVKEINGAAKQIEEYLAIAQEMYPNCDCVGYLVVFPIDDEIIQTHKVQLENEESGRTTLSGRQGSNKRLKYR